MIQIEHQAEEDIIVLRAWGTLSPRDYEMAVPELEHAMGLSSKPLRLLIRLEDFHGWEIAALWRDLKFDIRHLGDFERIAVVGETALEKWGTILSAPFTKAEMRYFPWERRQDALDWLRRDEAGRDSGT